MDFPYCPQRKKDVISAQIRIVDHTDEAEKETNFLKLKIKFQKIFLLLFL